jgi:hypothetical protein
MGQEVTIKIRAFPYYVDYTDPVTNREVRQERIASRGQTVELSDEDYERAVRFNAIETETDAELKETVGAFSVETASVEQLAEYIRAEKPSVDDLVDAANEDPNVAARILEAENLATGRQPRKTLVEKLSDLAADSQSTQADDDDDSETVNPDNK